MGLVGHESCEKGVGEECGGEVVLKEGVVRAVGGDKGNDCHEELRETGGEIPGAGVGVWGGMLGCVSVGG